MALSRKSLLMKNMDNVSVVLVLFKNFYDTLTVAGEKKSFVVKKRRSINGLTDSDVEKDHSSADV